MNLRIIGILALLSSASGRDGFNQLRTNNPFEVYAPHVLPPEPQLELRGVVVEDNLTLFSVYDPESKRSAWLKLGEQVAGYAATSYDAQRNVLSLQNEKASLSLTMKVAKVQLLLASKATAETSEGTQGASGEASNLRPPAVPLTAEARAEQIMNVLRERREARLKKADG